MIDTGAQDISSAGEKPGDFANADKPIPRVHRASGGGSISDEDLYGESAARRREAELDDSE
jgi:hypothetical protein